MKRTACWTFCLLIACGALFAADPSVLVRIERRTADDLRILRSAGLPIVMELDTCLLLEGSSDDLARLEKEGYEAKVLDSNPAAWDYLVVGLRPDSNLPSLESIGTVLLGEKNWILLRVPPRTTFEAFERAQVFLSRVPHVPVSLPRETPSLAPAPPLAAAGELVADPLVQQMVNSVSTTQINQFWTDLATNPPTGTRTSASQGCADAGTYCYNKYGTWGIPAAYQNWSGTYKPNVIGTQQGAINPGNVYIVIGHLDDMPSSGLAPGADDNASGSVDVLESARVMSCYAFRNTIKYINCTGEEQGLLGSEAYAADAASRGENILGVINMDMIGWQGDGSPNPENLDLNYNAASQDLGQRFAAAATTYGTGLAVDAFLCPSLNASDHYPFWTRGWKAVCGITDNEGYCSHGGSYPYYHTSNDTIANNGNPSFFYAVVKASVATLGELAEPFKIAYDRSVYPCGGGTVRIYLGDRDLNTNPSSAETVTVGITSDTETTPEDVVLTEQTVNSMIFTGTIPTSSGPPVHGDGLLSVSPDDHLTARYTDALDCNGATNVPYSVTAQTDCTGPVISGVQSLNVTGNSADVAWTTSEASSSVVHYGTTPPGGSSASSTALVTAHVVRLTGLAECSTYYFWVESADAAGNVATDDNGGAWYIFHTGKNVNPSYPYAGPPVSIPDNSATGASVTVSVPDVNTIVDVNVKVNVNHTFDGDLTLSLIGPDGTTVTLSNKRGSSGDNFTNTVFDDQATTPIASGTAPFTGSFKPDALLSAFNGKAPAGTWTLKAVDSASTDVGTIVGFELQLSYPPQACGPAIAYLSSTKADACNGSGAGGGNGVIEPGETVGLVVTARDNGTAPVSGISAILTTSTPGVTVTDGLATFPNLAAGASAPSNPDHFQFAVDPSFPCGTTINFAIQFTSNEGSWSDAFSHSTGTPGQSVNTYSSTDVPKTIADNATVTSNLPVSNSGTVGDVNATVTLTHTWDGDVTLVLIGPGATRVTLSARHGSSGDNYTGTVFDDEAATAIASGTPPYTGSFRPDSPLSAFDGGAAGGTWMLEANDAASGDTGTLTAWSLTLTATSAPTCLSCTPTQVAGEATNLHFLTGSKTDMEWTGAQYAASHNLYRGVAAQLPALLTAGTDSCRRLSVAGTSTGSVITEAPSPGAIYWYLVLGQNGAGEGSAGNATAGPRTLNSSGTCP